MLTCATTSHSQVQLRPPPARLAIRALRGLHRLRRRQQTGRDAEPEQARRRLRVWLPRGQRFGGERAPGRGQQRIQAGDAQQEVRDSFPRPNDRRARETLDQIRRGTWGERMSGRVRGCSGYLADQTCRTNRGQYSDAVLNELESQNDAQVEGILGKVRVLKDVRDVPACCWCYCSHHCSLR